MTSQELKGKITFMYSALPSDQQPRYFWVHTTRKTSTLRE